MLNYQRVCLFHGKSEHKKDEKMGYTHFRKPLWWYMMHRKPQTHRKDKILQYKSRSYFFWNWIIQKIHTYIRLGWKLGKSGTPLTWSWYLMTGQSQTGKITKFPMASWVFRTWVVCCRNEAVSPPFRALVNAWICFRPPMDSPNWESKQKSS